MKQASVVIKRIDTENSRMELRAGAKGTGKLIQSCTYWPRYAVSSDKAHEMMFDADQRAGVEIVQPQLD